jgi:hypothetical protein
MNVITANSHPSMLTRNYAPAYDANWAGVHPVVSTPFAKANFRPFISFKWWAEGTTRRHTLRGQAGQRGCLVYTASTVYVRGCSVRG